MRNQLLLLLLLLLVVVVNLGWASLNAFLPFALPSSHPLSFLFPFTAASLKLHPIKLSRKVFTLDSVFWELWTRRVDMWLKTDLRMGFWKEVVCNMRAKLPTCQEWRKWMCQHRKKRATIGWNTQRTGFSRDCLQGEAETKKWLLAACVINLIGGDWVLRFKTQI